VPDTVSPVLPVIGLRVVLVGMPLGAIALAVLIGHGVRSLAGPRERGRPPGWLR
jgi:hypothetical protein